MAMVLDPTTFCSQICRRRRARAGSPSVPPAGVIR
jgi:hypothetical protein